MSTFRIQQFAQLAGVTVRALHHYDRLKLLSPAHRSERGYRLYCHDDLGRLERILVLRFLGLSLREIAALLNAPEADATERLAGTLARQRAALSEKRNGLDCILRAIEHAQRRAQNSAEPEWLLYQTILKEIQMQEATDWRAKYYDPEAYEKLRAHRASMTTEQKIDAGARWRALLDDVQSALDRQVSPDSAEGRSLVARWLRLGDEFTLGDPEIAAGHARLQADASHWPQDETAAMLRSVRPKPEQNAFFREAIHACLRHG